MVSVVMAQFHAQIASWDLVIYHEQSLICWNHLIMRMSNSNLIRFIASEFARFSKAVYNQENYI
jgi:hypothetical protein